MKTARYYIQFCGVENYLSTRIEISKAEYNRQIAFLNKKVEETKDDEYPVENCVPSIFNETKEAITTIHFFNCGTSDVHLTKIECKEGYRFKNKR